MLKLNSNTHSDQHQILQSQPKGPQSSTQTEVQLKNPQVERSLKNLQRKKDCKNVLFNVILLFSICSFCIFISLLLSQELPQARRKTREQPQHELQEVPPHVGDLEDNQTVVDGPVAQSNTNSTFQIGNGQIKKSSNLQSDKDLVGPRMELHKNASRAALAELQIGQAQEYFEIDTLKQMKELPFCLVVESAQEQVKNKILQSIKNQNYSNIRTLFYDRKYRIASNGPIEDSFIGSNYYATYQILRQECFTNSLILFLKGPLRAGSLQYLSTMFNRYNVWLVYESTEKSVRIISFYLRAYELVGKKDFTGRAAAQLKNNNKDVEVFGLLKICASHTSSIQMSKIFVNEEQEPYFSAPLTSLKWSKLFGKNQRLSEDFENEVIFNPKWKKAALTKAPLPGMGLSLAHMLRAIQFQEIWYLPQNHSVAELEHSYYNKMYEVDRYNRIQSQVPFCVTILNHNNIQNDRYKKLLMSLLDQRYQNYHVVVIDDFSSDDSLTKIRELIEGSGFPRNRVVYVRNKQRLYATYNIMNAVYNFCAEDDIQLLLDGDDELIGRSALSVLNSAYQKDPSVWCVYSNYKSNLYHFGRSRGVVSQSQYKVNGRRNFISYMGPIRTWRVQLMYHLPLEYQVMGNGKWLDTAYDDSIQYSLLELATPSRVKYIPQLLYEYNRKYGDNDDSTPARLRYRNQTYEEYILSRQPLHPLPTLAGSQKLQEMAQIFQSDRNLKYHII